MQTVVLATSPQLPNILEKTAKLIPTIAERKCFGIKRVVKPVAVPPVSPPPMQIVPEDNPKEALYCWEIENFNMLELPNIKDIRARREQRKLLGQKVQKIWKLITTIKEVADVLNWNRHEEQMM